MIRSVLNFLRSLFKRSEEGNDDKMLEVIKESSTGKNLKFRDIETGTVYTLSEMRDLINKGEYPNYIVDRNGVVKSKPGIPNLG